MALPHTITVPLKNNTPSAGTRRARQRPQDWDLKGTKDHVQWQSVCLVQRSLCPSAISLLLGVYL